MTLVQLLQYINDNIQTNANNEITANVLNPVLQEIVGQINDKVGDLAGLEVSANSIVEAINNLPDPAESQGSDYIVHTGTGDPNFTPPAEYNVGDLYSRLDNGSPVALYIFNGQVWTEIASVGRRSYFLLETTSSVNIGFLFVDTVIYTGVDSSAQLQIPDPTPTNNGATNPFDRTRLTLVNRHNQNITTGARNYVTFTGSTSNVIPANSSIVLQSFGSDWHRIN